MTNASHDHRLPLLLAAWAVGPVISGWHPFDRTTWLMEVAPVMIAAPVLWTTRHRLPLTPIALSLMAVHGIVLMVGGAYSYARVPIGFDVQHWLGLARNPYDRFGHFAQGFVPFVVLRELLIRAGGLGRGRLTPFLTLACCLAISAGYELIEFGAAMALGQGADEFLGTQGDPWDTQWDMLMCLVGAVCAGLLLSRWHDRQMARIDRRTAP